MSTRKTKYLEDGATFPGVAAVVAQHTDLLADIREAEATRSTHVQRLAEAASTLETAQGAYDRALASPEDDDALSEAQEARDIAAKRVQRVRDALTALEARIAGMKQQLAPLAPQRMAALKRDAAAWCEEVRPEIEARLTPILADYTVALLMGGYTADAVTARLAEFHRRNFDQGRDRYIEARARLEAGG